MKRTFASKEFLRSFFAPVTPLPGEPIYAKNLPGALPIEYKLNERMGKIQKLSLILMRNLDDIFTILTDKEKMKEEFPIREEDEERIKNDFRLMKFRCIRCGFQDIEINEIEPHADGINFRSVGQPAKPKKDIKTTFYVTGLLFCRRCNHRFHVKISDQGPRNTNLYFNNMLT